MNKFYTEAQNNSGGYNINNDVVSDFLVIEASSPNEAKEIAQRLVKDYRDYCYCCGERWSLEFDETDAFDVPSAFGTPLEEVEGYFKGDEAIIHYKNGNVEKVILGGKEE